MKPARAPRWLATITGLLALAGGAAAAYAHWPERTRIQLDRFTVRVDRAGLPPEGLTILHLSDFHFRAEDRVQSARLERLRRLLIGQPYDILAVTGDLIHDEPGLPAALAFLSTLRPRLAAFSVPGNRDYQESSFLAVLGRPEQRRSLSPAEWLRLVFRNLRMVGRMFTRNERATLPVRRNDVPAMNAELRRLGIEPLTNRAAAVHHRDIDLWLAGVDDLTQGKPDLAAALSAVPEHALLVLLAHNPDAWLDPLSSRADLILSGHTHGGQLNFPLVGAMYRQGTHFDRQKAAGWFERGTTSLFVTRGLGESFPFRFGARPQAALIRLVPSR